MITSSQMRAARALLGIDQRQLAAASRPVGADHPAHGGERRRRARQCRFADEAGRCARRQRHRADRRGRRLERGGGRGVRLKELTRGPARRSRRGADGRARLCGVAGAAALRRWRWRSGARDARDARRLWREPASSALMLVVVGVAQPRRRRPASTRDAAARAALARRAFPHRCAVGVLPGRGQSRRRGGEPLRARLRPARGRARAACCRSIPPSSPP